MTTTLQKHRLEAAEASGGISSDVIHDRILQIASGLHGRVIDYGGGVGNLTKRLWNLGTFTQVSGADIMARPRDLPDQISWHHLDLNDPYALPQDAYDVVIASEVIEHLENPREVAREWYRITSPGGALIASTPNNESVRSFVALLMRGHYAAFGDASYPAHITALLRKDFSRILGEAGFSGVQFHFTNNGGIPKMPNVTWQQISLDILKGRWFSDNLIVTARKPRDQVSSEAPVREFPNGRGHTETGLS